MHAILGVKNLALNTGNCASPMTWRSGNVSPCSIHDVTGPVRIIRW